MKPNKKTKEVFELMGCFVLLLLVVTVIGALLYYDMDDVIDDLI